jgi:hypothetical protein
MRLAHARRAIGSHGVEPTFQFPQNGIVVSGGGIRSAQSSQLLEGSHRRDVVWRFSGCGFEFGQRFVDVPLRQESSTERQACGGIGRMQNEAGAADTNRIVQPARTPVLLGELCESDRRRVATDPAFEILDS